MATATRTLKTKARKTQAKRGLTFRVTVVVEPDGEEFHAYCPGLKGLHMPGATVEEAVENARIAAQLFFECMIEYGDPIPIGPQLDPDGKRQHDRWPKRAKGIHLESAVIRLE